MKWPCSPQFAQCQGPWCKPERLAFRPGAPCMAYMLSPASLHRTVRHSHSHTLQLQPSTPRCVHRIPGRRGRPPNSCPHSHRLPPVATAASQQLRGPAHRKPSKAKPCRESAHDVPSHFPPIPMHMLWALDTTCIRSAPAPCSCSPHSALHLIPGKIPAYSTLVQPGDASRPPKRTAHHRNPGTLHSPPCLLQPQAPVYACPSCACCPAGLSMVRMLLS